MNSSNVVGLGSVMVDEQMFLDSIPAEDQKEKATQIRQQIGGPVPTALAMVRKYDQQCHFIGPWGDDSQGIAIREDLDAEKITWSENSRMTGRRSGIAHVWTSNSTGSRTIVTNQCSWDSFQLSENDWARINACHLLHLDGTGANLAVNAATHVRSNGGLVTVDAGSPKEATEALIPLANVFNFPERFARQFFDHEDVIAAGKEILSRGAAAAVCTRGSKGAILFVDDDVVEISAHQVTTIDSTGAGDVFCGGLIAALLNGRSLNEAVRCGAASAALKIQQVGNRNLPSPTEVEALVQSMLLSE